MNKLKCAMWCLLLIPAILLAPLAIILKYSFNAVNLIQVWLFDKCIEECEKYEDE